MPMKKWVEFDPGYDRRDPDPSKNYGIHGVAIRFVIQGDAGAVQFLIYTDWFPESVERCHTACHSYPMAADLGYHSPKPMYEGQTMIQDKCKILNGPCYCDGSRLNAEPVLNALIDGGDDAVWHKLGSYYNEIFGD